MLKKRNEFSDKDFQESDKFCNIYLKHISVVKKRLVIDDVFDVLSLVHFCQVLYQRPSNS